MELEKILNEQINKLNEAINLLGGLDILHTEGSLSKKKLQSQLNQGFSKMVDVKMDLEKIIKEMGKK